MLLLRLRELESAQIGWPATAQTQQMRSGLVRGTLVISAYIVAPGRQVRLLQVLPDEYRRLDRAAEPCEDVLADQQGRSEEHTSELQSRGHLVCRLLLEKKNHH